ncbi:hypothetical protein [Mesorhizobium sp.]|uniref:hypothetical protein n=1 Tax=Mesorhizobium sp. TaxID=1871066 RepID=UPI00261FF2AC|nr:hypothetical protein [Mesorhizobium sp.]
MKRLLTVAALLAAGSLIAMQGAAADDAALIKSAESAAPAAVASGAAVYAMDEKGNMRTLREGPILMRRSPRQATIGSRRGRM